MDFQKFSDESFDVKDWINSALKAHKDAGQSLDAHASNLVMKLQLFIQEVNKSLEETSQIAVNNLPRVLREVEGIKIEAASLKEQMQMVKDVIKGIEESTSQSMKTLVDIDNVKERLQAASNALQEADNWTTLSSDVDEIFKTGNVVEISSKLIGMQKSLNVLEDVPDFAERKRLLESLKNKLEALLSTKLVTAFNGHLLDEAKYYVKIFTEVGRLEQMQTYYTNCHKGNALKIWNELREENPTSDFTQWLSKFYDILLSLWHKEIVWCSQVFQDPVSVLGSLMVQILSQLEPPISECIRRKSANEDDVELSLLIQVKEISSRLLNGLESSIKSMQVCTFSVDSMLVLVAKIQEPYVPYLIQYSAIQQIELMNGIEAMNLNLSELSETVAIMSESVGNAFRLAEEARNSCMLFTDGYGSLGLLDALQNFFSAYLGRLDGLITDLRNACCINGEMPDDSNLDDENQWSNFQNSFKMIEMCGNLLVRLADYRENLTKELKIRLNKIFSSSEDEWMNQCNYLQQMNPTEFLNLKDFSERVHTYDINTVLASTQEQIERLNEHSHRFAFDVVFIYLKRKLDEIPKLPIWHSNSPSTEAVTDDLPTFSLSPQSCITDVGDYLLTLPQQLEPFFTHENSHLFAALKAGQIPFADKHDCDVDDDHYWVIGFARGTMNVFVDNILRIPELATSHATQQLIADIDYLCNIFEAVEVSPNNDLQAIKELLVVDKEKFHEKATDLSVEKRIEESIARIRNV